jgi:hypothetical protein
VRCHERRPRNRPPRPRHSGLAACGLRPQGIRHLPHCTRRRNPERGQLGTHFGYHWEKQCRTSVCQHAAVEPPPVHVRWMLFYLRTIGWTSRPVDRRRYALRCDPGELEMSRLRHRKVNVPSLRRNAAIPKRNLKNEHADRARRGILRLLAGFLIWVLTLLARLRIWIFILLAALVRTVSHRSLRQCQRIVSSKKRYDSTPHLISNHAITANEQTHCTVFSLA